MKLLLILFLKASRGNQRQNPKGFMMVFVMAFGLLLSAIGVGMMLRSQQQAILTTTQVQVLQAEDNLDAGVIHLQTFLDHNRPLMKRVSWSNIVNGTSENDVSVQKLLKVCETESEWQSHKKLIEQIASGTLHPISMESQLSLKEYKYDADKNRLIALLLVHNNKEGLPTSQVKLELEVLTPPVKLPALWLQGQAEQKGTGNVFIEGDLWANNCQFPFLKTYSNLL